MELPNARHGFPAAEGGVPPSPHYAWPPVTERTESAVLRQLRSPASVYDRSGIVLEFEEKFSSYHGRRRALANNSGTSALLSMYWGAGIGPGDEVICPAYTFFATASPLLHLGAVPVLCDCGPDGNIDPSLLPGLLSARTRAVVVTHMWGVPCDMDPIVSFCRANRLALFEDCSHAHGARYKGRVVGTFGDAAAWSLQGQKIVTGGEAGILLTDDDGLYHRAQLLGHFNKRCLAEIPPESPLYRYAVTGAGLKFRASPLALAFANEQMDHLDAWLARKREYASRITRAISGFPFVRPPSFEGKEPSWYAYAFLFLRDDHAWNRDLFVRHLHARGLEAVDVPGSTAPIGDFPLFREPSGAIPSYPGGPAGNASGSFPASKGYHAAAVKMPVWALESDSPMVDWYARGLHDALAAVRDGPG